MLHPSGLASLELATSAVTVQRSNQLIYSPKIVGIRNLLLGKELPVCLLQGFEPSTERTRGGINQDVILFRLTCLDLAGIEPTPPP